MVGALWKCVGLNLNVITTSGDRRSSRDEVNHAVKEFKLLELFCNHGATQLWCLK